METTSQEMALPNIAPRVSLDALSAERAEVELRVQIIAAERKETKTQKPYMELVISDGSAPVKLRVWDNHSAYPIATTMEKGSCYALTGTFWRGDFGVESDNWSGRLLEGEERTAVFSGPPEVMEKQAKDWMELLDILEGMSAGPLKIIACELLTKFEGAFRRAAAARTNHHARRGGLVEHVAWMAKAAAAICGVYPELRKDLLIAAVIFHDSGKLVENHYEESGFEMPFSYRAEGLGHIVIGLEIARNLWGALPKEVQDRERTLYYALTHCITSHHGQLEWGSPVIPKSPEAIVLHYIDNMDAKLEMARAVRKTGKVLAPGVIEGPYIMRTVLETPAFEP